MGCHFLLQGIIPTRIKSVFPALVDGFFTLNHVGAYDPVVKNLLANAGDTRDAGLIPGLGRLPGGGNGNPLQYSCLEHPMDRGAWQALVRGVAKGWTQLSTHTRLLPPNPLPARLPHNTEQSSLCSTVVLVAATSLWYKPVMCW